MGTGQNDLAHESLLPHIEAALLEHLPRHSELSTALIDAMRYSTTAGGKRVRPLLTLAGCAASGADWPLALLPACAVEYVHTYSLIHDDLPAMDDDALRRGKATCHVAFDEATAILAGNGLLTHAFDLLLAADCYPCETRIAMLRALTRASGHQGMLAGQAFDLASEGKTLTPDQLRSLHRAKTGAMIAASVRIGALAGGCDSEQDLRRLDDYAQAIGLAFQVTDDVLNVVGNPALLGKQVGTDVNKQKNTYPALMGLASAQQYARDLTESALAALAPFDERARWLRDIASALCDRNR